MTKTAPKAVPATLEEFMTLALVMENEAVERYNEFADAMEAHNNREIAAMFRKMAGYEAKHAAHIMMEMGWTEPPPLPQAAKFWPGFEGPETVPQDEIHYLMQPMHALELALAGEQRAEKLFAALANVATDPRIKRAALELMAEETEHVALVKQWMAKVPKPEQDWATDPDPPRMAD